MTCVVWRTNKVLGVKSLIYVLCVGSIVLKGLQIVVSVETVVYNIKFHFYNR